MYIKLQRGERQGKCSCGKRKDCGEDAIYTIT